MSAPPQGNRPPASIQAPFAGAAVLPPPDLTDDGPGSLVDVQPLEDSVDFDRMNVVGVRVLYRSTNAKGTATTVSGVVAVPPGKQPSGGWPILAFGHDIIGMLKDCAPSSIQDLGGYASVISVLADRGYVVAMTDYEGLGVDGFPHPLLDSTTLGHNMIDAVRAARRVLPSASNRWAAFGLGQGGAATWAADAQAASYGTGLDLVGAVAVSPLANMTGLADAMENETLVPAQFRLAMLAVTSLVLSPDTRLNPDDYVSENAKALFGELTNCAVVDPVKTVAAAAGLKPGDLKPRTPAAAEDLRRDLQDLALPGPAKLSAPMLLIYATIDPVVLPGWIEDAVRTACGRGDPIEVKKIGDVNALNDIVLYDSVAWFQGRFSGQRAMNTCVGV
ncbi:lipase family protein [Mycolicibacterium moriokaense]|uniref:lipase family protein n=1 Tax=Mycolicibacterium moriokaense TaxID=39691 RepID=UPI0015E8D2A0|nr:lipase family protein [Mycolicibacterium moriokaense]